MIRAEPGEAIYWPSRDWHIGASDAATPAARPTVAALAAGDAVPIAALPAALLDLGTHSGAFSFDGE